MLKCLETGGCSPESGSRPALLTIGWCLLLSTTGSFAISAPASAQESAEASATRDIVVTARKRQELLMNVPVVETVLTSDRLDRAQAVDLKDIATLAPGLSIGENILAIGTQISLRGVGTSTADPGVDQSVILNIDGLSLSQGLAFQSGTFDLGQVEVLKGPQALFYGKSSTGGVISLRTADPTSEFEIIGRGGYEFEANQRRGELIVSGPVSETLKLRLAGMYSKSDGFFYNRAVADPSTGAANPRFGRISPSENYIVRGTVLWRPSDALDVRAKANFVRDKVYGGGVGQYVSCPDGIGGYPGLAAAGIPAIQFLSPSEDCRQNRTVYTTDLNPAFFPGLRFGGAQLSYETQKFGTVEVNLHPTDAVTLTSTTGYYDVEYDGAFNISQTGFAAPIFGYENAYERNDFTQELRVNSEYDGPVNFTAGVYYQSAKVRNTVSLIANRAYVVAGGGTLTSDFISRPGFNIDSLSGFGQIRFQPTDEFEIAAGARYTDEERRGRAAFIVDETAVPVVLPDPKISSGRLSPELTVTFKPDPDLTIFASAKRGYKSGSYNLSPVVPGVTSSFGDERVQGGEAGLKTRLLDRRLSINLAGYYYDYSGLQVGATQVIVGTPVSTTLNAGKSRVYGLDFDASYAPSAVPDLTLRAGVTWNRSRFVDLDDVPCSFGQTQAEGCVQQLDPATGRFTAQSLDGSPLVRSPRWQGNFGFDYDLSLRDGKKLSFTSENSFSSRYLANLGSRRDFYQKGYVMLGLGVALRGKDDRWEVAVVGRNLTNVLRSNYCPSANNAFGLVAIPGLDDQTGSTVRGRGGVAEVGCVMAPGRAVWLRLTLRPLN
jgi:iron complex outermembrane receptor protein